MQRPRREDLLHGYGEVLGMRGAAAGRGHSDLEDAAAGVAAPTIVAGTTTAASSHAHDGSEDQQGEHGAETTARRSCGPEQHGNHGESDSEGEKLHITREVQRHDQVARSSRGDGKSCTGLSRGGIDGYRGFVKGTGRVGSAATGTSDGTG